jgi:hypothetical protein
LLPSSSIPIVWYSDFDFDFDLDCDFDFDFDFDLNYQSAIAECASNRPSRYVQQSGVPSLAASS